MRLYFRTLIGEWTTLLQGNGAHISQSGKEDSCSLYVVCDCVYDTFSLHLVADR